MRDKVNGWWVQSLVRRIAVRTYILFQKSGAGWLIKCIAGGREELCM